MFISTAIRIVLIIGILAVFAFGLPLMKFIFEAKQTKKQLRGLEKMQEQTSKSSRTKTRSAKGND